jgi:hypothetical protein
MHIFLNLNNLKVYISVKFVSWNFRIISPVLQIFFILLDVPNLESLLVLYSTLNRNVDSIKPEMSLGTAPNDISYTNKKLLF